MPKNVPISAFMTKSPHTVGRSQTLAHAHEVMRKHHIRHLPVLDGGKLVGLVTERDLRLIETLKDVDPSQVTVDEAMSQEVYSVTPDALLADVAKAMAEHKYGSAIVMEAGAKVVGIFTTVDAMSALSDLLQK
jgi:acetoin utilization protein AcuB